MSFILRAVLILIIFSFVVYVFKMVARLSFQLRGAVKDVQKIRQQVGGKPVAGTEMVRCAACGSFVAARDAVKVTSGNSSQIFCSRECVKVS